MTPEAVLTVSAVIIALVQYLKWSNLIPDKRAPVVVAALAAFGVTVWVISFADELSRRMVFSLVAAWINVTLNAAGIYGFARTDIAQNLTKGTPPPSSKMEE